jgi:hypothetical protein
MRPNEGRFVSATDAIEPLEAVGNGVSFKHALGAPFRFWTVVWQLIIPGVLVVACEHFGSLVINGRADFAMVFIPGMALLEAAAFAFVLAGALGLVNHSQIKIMSAMAGVRRAHWVVVAALLFASPQLLLFLVSGKPPVLGAHTWLAVVSAAASGLVGTRLFLALPAAMGDHAPFLRSFRTPLPQSTWSLRNRLILWALATGLSYVSLQGTYGQPVVLGKAYAILSPILAWPLLAVVWADLYKQVGGPPEKW